jgi:flagellar hook-associated protein 2
MAAITSTGLGSGLDVNGIVTKLVAAERMSADTRNSKVEATDNAKITAYGTFKGALSDFKATVTSLSQSSNYQNITATSSDSAVVSASALSVADVGDYQLKVNTLAQSHALASKAYTEATSIVGSGNLTVNFGTTVYDPVTKVYSGFTQSSTKSSLSLTIDSTNNTLVGIRDAINGAKAGVTASILNDGTGNRLILKSNETGLSNSIQVQASEVGGAGLSALAFDGSNPNMVQTQTAENASVTINGLEVTSPSNTISSALKGVTFNLLQAKPSQIVNININRNNDALTTKLSTFVEKYNALTAAVKSVSSYDAATKKGGVLLGDYVLQSGMSQVKAAMTDMVEGVSGNLKTLTDVGIGLQKDGSLSFDKAKLSAAQSSDIDAVTSLFAVIGRPTDANVQYIISTKDTQAGSFNVVVSKAASQGALSTTALTFPLLFGLQVWQLNSCDNMVGSVGIKSVIALAEGFIIGGTGYGIVQSTIPERLPSHGLPKTPLLSSMTKNPDGTYSAADGTVYVIGPNGEPVPQDWLTKNVQDATSQPKTGSGVGSASATTCPK